MFPSRRSGRDNGNGAGAVVPMLQATPNLFFLVDSDEDAMWINSLRWADLASAPPNQLLQDSISGIVRFIQEATRPTLLELTRKIDLQSRIELLTEHGQVLSLLAFDSRAWLRDRIFLKICFFAKMLILFFFSQANFVKTMEVGNSLIVHRPFLTSTRDELIFSESTSIYILPTVSI